MLKCIAWVASDGKSCDREADYIVGGWSVCEEHCQGLIDTQGTQGGMFAPLHRLYEVGVALLKEEQEPGEDS